jgi:hypothetical protein
MYENRREMDAINSRGSQRPTATKQSDALTFYSQSFGHKLPSLRLPAEDEIGYSPVTRNVAP